MRTLLTTLAFGALFPLGTMAEQPSSNSTTVTAIEQPLIRYQQALNSSDVGRVMVLYTGDPTI